MRLLSDFDGVWTHPLAEARAQGEILEGLLVEWSAPGTRDAVRAWLAAAREAVSAEPGRWGWAPGGAALAAFGDEDPFAAHSALLHYLHAHRDEPLPASLVAAIAAHGFATLDAFGGYCHAEGVARVEAERGPGIPAGVADAGRALLAMGVEIVVVSNSRPDKLARWFAHAGVPATLHPERASGALRLRGSARKFALDPGARAPLDVGGLRFETRRPSYEAVLREEAPGAIAGDVFSLDLALPLALKLTEPGWRAVRLFWLVQDYTPARLREAIGRGARDDVEPVEGGLAALAARLLAAG